MPEGDYSLGHEGVGDGDIEFMDELGELLPGAGADDTIACQYYGQARPGDDFRGTPDTAGGRFGGGGLLRQQGRFADFQGGDIFRKFDKTCPGFFSLGQFKGLAHHLGDDLGGQQARGVFGDRQENALQIQHLV